MILVSHLAPDLVPDFFRARIPVTLVQGAHHATKVVGITCYVTAYAPVPTPTRSRSGAVDQRAERHVATPTPPKSNAMDIATKLRH